MRCDAIKDVQSFFAQCGELRSSPPSSCLLCLEHREVDTSLLEPSH